jgi:hypothetical protein
MEAYLLQIRKRYLVLIALELYQRKQEFFHRWSRESYLDGVCAQRLGVKCLLQLATTDNRRDNDGAASFLSWFRSSDPNNGGEGCARSPLWALSSGMHVQVGESPAFVVCSRGVRAANCECGPFGMWRV